MVVFGQGGLEIGRGDWFGRRLYPLHWMKRLLLKRSIIPRTNIALSLRTRAAVVVVGDIQALMQTVLNAPMIPVQTHPVVRARYR